MATAESYRVVFALPTGTAFSRYLKCLGEGRGDTYRAMLAAEHFKNSPTVLATFELRQKAAVAPATTPDSIGRRRSQRTALPARRSHSQRGISEARERQRRATMRAEPSAPEEYVLEGKRTYSPMRGKSAPDNTRAILNGMPNAIIGLEACEKLYMARLLRLEGLDVIYADGRRPDGEAGPLQRFAALEAEVAALKARPELHCCGTYQDATQYSPGSLVTRSGSLWLATAQTAGNPGADPHWKLIVKSGRAT